MTDRELQNIAELPYLERPLLPGLEFIITDEVLKVTSDSSVFIHNRKAEIIGKNELLEKYKKVYGLCRENGVKISYGQRCKKSIMENYSKYLEETEKHNKIFKELKEMLLPLKDRGVHYGCAVDDEYLDSCIKKSWEMNPYHYRNTAAEKIRETNYFLDSLLNKNFETLSWVSL